MKLVIEEDGSPEAEALWNGADAVASSPLGRVEGHAALASARRSARLGARGLAQARENYERHWRGVREIALSPAVVDAAVTLTHRHGLRGYDAVHLASALALVETGITLATWDVELRRGATAEGLPVAPARL